MTDNSYNRGDSSRKPYIAPFLDLVPEIEDTVFVAATAAIMGAVRVGAHSSIWHQVTLRGDNNYILIGSNTNIQDNSCATSIKASPPPKNKMQKSIGCYCIFADRCV